MPRRSAPTSRTLSGSSTKRSSLPDSEHYKLVDVKEDALSNRFKYLDVLCFPTLFPTAKCSESHPRRQLMRHLLMNKDGRFRKEDQDVFFQKEMRE